MKRTFRLFSLALLLVMLVTLTGTSPTPAYAAQTTINSTYQGWIHSSGFQIPGNTNYLVGYAGNEYRDFFVFNLSGVSGNIFGATLRINVAGYESMDPFETVEFYDVTTPVSTLADGSGGPAAYADLGTGTFYGSVTITGADGYQTIDIPLNAEGVAAVRSALGGDFAIGGAMSTYNDNLEYVFGDSMNFTAQLILTTDTTPPVVTVPWTMVVEAVDSNGADVSYTVFAIDETAPSNPVVTCDPVSGSNFALDSNTMVSCSANDSAGNTGYGYFQVQVVDTTPPVVLVPTDISVISTKPVVLFPADMSVNAANSSGAVVAYNASAADLVDGALTASCNWPSGTTFPIGTTVVTCTAVDAHNNTGVAFFNVNVVEDTVPPEFSLVLDNPNEATGPSGAIVNFSATFTDSGSGMASSSCLPASGSLFPIGTTTVNCSGTDNAGNTSAPSFNVIVHDTTPPQLSLPANLFVPESIPDGAIVNYEASATDLVSGDATVTCNPVSGSFFPLGTTTVNCSATDGYQNTANGSFEITVNAGFTAVFTSTGRYDGTFKETKETSNVGSTPIVTGGFLDVGDGLNDLQLLSILHFDTSSLPDNAVITNVTLRIRQYRFIGASPFLSLGDLQVDITSPFFGAEMALKPGDFQAPAAATNVGIFNSKPLSNNWFEAVLQSNAFSFLNTGGTTQFRIHFTKDDNDDKRNNLLRFYSGDSPTATNRPVLIVEYYVP